jgi:hypothetical protein
MMPSGVSNGPGEGASDRQLNRCDVSQHDPVAFPANVGSQLAHEDHRVAQMLTAEALLADGIEHAVVDEHPCTFMTLPSAAWYARRTMVSASVVIVISVSLRTLRSHLFRSLLTISHPALSLYWRSPQGTSPRDRLVRHCRKGLFVERARPHHSEILEIIEEGNRDMVAHIGDL